MMSTTKISYKAMQASKQLTNFFAVAEKEE
jgi:hypothetical protein